MQSPNCNTGKFSLFELPARVKYAILALMELAKAFESQKAMTVKEIATEQPIPERYLEQVLLSLRQSGLVQSYRGARGGYVLNQEPSQITMLDVVISVEGQQTMNKRLSSPSFESRIINQIWRESQLKAQAFLQQQTIGDLLQKSLEDQQLSLTYFI